MIEMREARLAAEEITRRMAPLTAAILLETREGLPADWTAIAEGFETVRDLAASAANAAWIITGEDDYHGEQS